jgi:selenocysteine lyase/cysteine desulfurase
MDANHQPDSSGFSNRRDLFAGLLGASGAVLLGAACVAPNTQLQANEPGISGSNWLAAVREAAKTHSQLSDSRAWQNLWAEVRRGYAENLIYLNPGSHALPSVAVTDRMGQLTQQRAANPHIFNEYGEQYVKEVLRPRIARLLGLGDASEVMVSTNATQGNHAVALAVLINKTGEVVRAATEHATTTSIPRWLAQSGAITEKLVSLPTGADATTAEIVARYEAAVTAKTLLLVVPAVSYAEGHRLPLTEIALAVKSKNPNIHIHVDAAHALGMFPIDVPSWRCDSAAFSGHKWAGGPEPTGALWVSREKKASLPHPFIAAGTDVYTEGTGAANLVNLLALDAALELQEILGPQRIWQRITEQRDVLARLLAADDRLELLSSPEPALHSGMISVRATHADAGALAKRAMGLADTVVYRALTDFGQPVLRFGVPISSSPEEIRAGVSLALRTF